MIYYQDLKLDRAGEQRKNPDWLRQQWTRQQCRVFILRHDKSLMRRVEGVAAGFEVIRFSCDEIHALGDVYTQAIFLGHDQSTPLFAIDTGELDDTAIAAFAAGGEFVDLREIGWLLDAQQAAQMAYARGLAYWNRHHRFCGKCGSPTVSENGGHMRRCSNDGCGKLHFPRTDPAVIMLVEDRSDPTHPRCLLGRNSRFPSRMMSTLAGFVDPLESLEECVAREVFEECGIEVTKIEYQASQPWPFPASIMLGFRAQASSLEINIDQDEIEEAYWFDAEQLKTFGEWGDDGDNFCLPRRDSIARWLIQTWIDEQT